MTPLLLLLLLLLPLLTLSPTSAVASNIGSAAAAAAAATSSGRQDGGDGGIGVGAGRLTMAHGGNVGRQCTDHCASGLRNCSGEQRAKESLLCGYDRTSRPVLREEDQIRVHIAVALFHILDADEKHQTFTTLMSIRLRWQDEHLAWQPEDFNGTKTIHVPSSSIWTPDIVISNSADDSSKRFASTNIVVQEDGSVLWMFPAQVKVTCNLAVRYFPFDSQSCNVTFISWTYHLYQVDLWHDESVDANRNYFSEASQEWNVTRITFARSTGVYACCREPWPDVTITIGMTRRSLFYVLNLIFPCALMYLSSWLGFFLPAESGEKVNLELTIMLALVVFLLIVGDTLPPTPDAIPLVGLLFGSTMLMVSLALLMAVIVTNVHVRKFTRSADPVPACLRRYVSRFHCQRNCRYQRRRRHDDQPGVKELTEDEAEAAIADGDNRGKLRELHAIGGEVCLCNSPDAWAALARSTDRILFWLFLAISVGAIVVIYQSVPNNALNFT